MSDVKWIKISTNIFDDEKFEIIGTMPDSDAIELIWFKLLVFAGKTNNKGLFLFKDHLAYTDEMLAAVFHKPLNTVRLAMNTFIELDMIEVIEGVYTIPNWDKYQSLDQYEKHKERDREYHKRRRQQIKEQLLLAKKGEEECECANESEQKTSIDGRVDAPFDCPVENGLYLSLNNINNKDKEIVIECEEEEEGKKKKEKKSRNIIPPTLEMVEAYCNERNNGINAQRFLDYYDARGWVLTNRKKMVDWQAAVRNWESSGFNKKGGGNNGLGKLNKQPRYDNEPVTERTDEELERELEEIRKWQASL